MEENALARKRAVRGGNRSVITKLCNEAEGIIKGDAGNHGRLDTIYGLLEKKLQLVQALDDEIVATCAVEEIVAEIEEAETITSRVLDTQRDIAAMNNNGKQNGATPPVETTSSKSSQHFQGEPAQLTGNIQETSPTPHQSSNEGMSFSFISNNSSTSQHQQSKTKLPKLTLKKFKGEVTEWQTFWDLFDSAINKNNVLNSIDKFSYLKSLLEGPAERAIQGLTLTDANYFAAIEILKDRFGKRQQIITSHMDDLLKIPACTNEKAYQLRLVYDKISVNVRSLEALGIDSQQYGSLLIPIIMSKLPQQIRVQIARTTTQEVWKISELLEVIKKEVDAREISESVKVDNSTASERFKFSTRSFTPTASALVASMNSSTRNNQFQCVYCSEGHYSASCPRVVDRTSRLDILKRDRRCFVCLKVGHTGSRCERKCRRCNGKHHQSLCIQTTTKSKESFPQNKELFQTHVNTSSTSQQKNVPDINEMSITSANESKPSSNTISASASVKSSGSVLLQTATAIATNETGIKSSKVKILFDNGSQRSYVTEHLKSKLGLKSMKTETLNLNTFGDNNYRKQKCATVSLNLRDKNNKEIAEISVLSTPVICSPLPKIVNLNKFPHLKGIELADDSDSQDPVDILIGSDYYWNFVFGNTIRGEIGPTAIESAFGWLVSGPTTSEIKHDNYTVSNLIISGQCHDFEEHSQDHLILSLKQFWQTENIGIDSQSFEENEMQIAPEILRTKHNYEVGLPFKADRLPSSNNYNLCASRLKSLHHKLRKEPKLLQEYDHIIKEQEKQGIVEKIPSNLEESKIANTEGIHYSPHHAVIRKDRETTKVRIVYDGSAKQQNETSLQENSVSLNDCLEVGPNYIPHIFDMLSKFRNKPIGLTADIEKAYLMVSIKPEHRDMLRFLWFDKVDSEIPKLREFRFNRLVFGLRSSPSILGAIINHHVKLYEQTEPEMSQLLSKSFYVDDFVSGAENEDEGFEIYVKSKKIMREGGFNLRKWSSNSRKLMTKIASSERKYHEIEGKNNNLSIFDSENTTTGSTNQQGDMSSCEDNSNANPTNQTKLFEDDESYAKSSTRIGNSASQNENIVKVLGMNWNTLTDEFFFDFSQLHEYAQLLPVTKRSVLKVTSKIFDPLGFLTPMTIRMKALFQDICISNINWDAELTGENLKLWNVMLEELKIISSVRIPRCHFSSHPVNTQLHAFSDASELAFAAAIYMRSEYDNGKIDVKLVASKTRVAPLKRQTIPRLELLGAVIQARLTRKYSTATENEAIKTTHWTDSMATLCWIKNDRQWKQYVKHRVTEIRNLTSRQAWRHCPGKHNPADLPSRGVSAKDLTLNEMWWNGPEFLYRPENEWPETKSTQTEDESVLQELLKNPINVTHSLASNVLHESNVNDIIDPSRFSDLNKLLRVTAYVLRFVQKPKEQQKGHLTAEEISKAEELWIKSVQRKLFQDEIRHLRDNKNASIPPLIRQFNLYLDKNNVLRCKGRISNSTLPQNSKNPILLPNKHVFVNLIISHTHERAKHCGVRDTLTTIREKYWILRGRVAVKKVLRKCVSCRKIEGYSYGSCPSPDLPDERVSEDPPFTHTGLDFAGPLYISQNKNKANAQDEEHLSKAYICLFTCASTRAVHLELTRELTVCQFLQAFRRFIARRGLPATLISDNAKTYKAASKEVVKIARSTEVQQYLANNRITWKFIIEKAPWWGGFWERLIQSIKKPIKKILGKATIDYDEMSTILIEVEGVINARPLTYVYDDEDTTSRVLTPSDLIYGRRITTMPNSIHFEIVSTFQALTKRHKYLKGLMQQITKQWRNEYLLNLRENTNCKQSKRKNTSPVKIGDVVILKNDSKPGAFWKLATVEELVPGKDGMIRAAIVRSTNKAIKPLRLRRVIQHLIPLEVRATSELSATKTPQETANIIESRSRRTAAIIGEMRRRELVV